MSAHKRMRLDPCLSAYMKINSEWSKDLKMRAQTTEPLQENAGEKLHDIGFDSDFSGVTPKTQAAKGKIN